MRVGSFRWFIPILNIMRLISGSIITATALGFGTLALRPADWWPWVRGTYVVTPGVLAGGVAVALLIAKSSPDEQPDPRADSVIGHGPLQRARSLSLPARMVMSVGFGVTVSAMQAGSLCADAGIEAWLFRRGVTHPRRWMAGTVAAMTLLGDLVETDHTSPPVAEEE